MQSQQTLQNGRYRISKEMGRGGMGIIYKGRDQNLQGRLVAIKENLDSNRDSQKQFWREAVILAKLNHPNLPRVTDYFVEPSGRQYLIMDYIDGMDLKDIVRKMGPLPESDVLLWIEQVMDALEYLHGWIDPDTKESTPVIHRDIKPSNIRRRPGNQIMLVDFGIAKVGNSSTWAGARSITPGYSPIEQYGDETDARSDIYSLGATLYYLLTGVAPPEVHQDISPVRKVNPNITAHTARVIQRAMQRSAHERYQNVQEMRENLFGPNWWERIDLPISGSVLPRIGDALTGRTTEPHSTGSRRTGDRDTASQRTNNKSTKSKSTINKKTSSQKPTSGLHSTSEQKSPPTPRRNVRKSSFLLLLYMVIVVVAALIFMNAATTPISDEVPSQPVVVALATDTATAALLPSDTPAPTLTPSSTPTVISTSTPSSTPSLTPSPTPMPVSTTPPAASVEAVPDSMIAPPSSPSTSTPASTWTVTVLPTHTSAATATTIATNTATPTLSPTVKPTLAPSSTPRPVLTSTPQPSPTPTPTVTSTAISTVTPTVTSIATSTATSTLLPSATPTPTAASTATFTVTPTPRPTSTSTRTSTPTYVPTATGVPLRPNRDLFSEGDRADSVSVELSEPLSFRLSGKMDFRWKLSGISLVENEAYEVIFWDQSGKAAYSLGDAGLTSANKLTIKLDGAIKELELLKAGNEYRWGIALVQVEPHKRLAYLGGGHLFYLESSQE